jgi:hypothetical protein
MPKVRAEREAGETAALLQQYQQMSALIGARSSLFASNTASMLNATMQGLNLSARMADDNLAINFNSSGTADQIRKREEYYKKVNHSGRAARCGLDRTPALLCSASAPTSLCS